MEVTQRISAETNKLIMEGKISEVVFMLESVITEATGTLGLLYSDHLHDERKAIECYNTASNFDKGNWGVLCNMTHVLNHFNRYKEAKSCAIRAVKLNENEFSAVYNLAVVLGNLGEMKEAIECYKKCVQLNPEHPQVRHNLAAAYLSIGDYENGWKEYEYRRKASPKTDAFFARFGDKLWNGSDDLTGKKLYVFSEQGIGDLLQFVRFLPLLKNAEITFEVQEVAKRIIKQTFPEIKVVPRNNFDYPDPGDYDYAVSICSLPTIFNLKQDQLSSEPYLFADKKRVKHKFPKSKVHVGIAWAGNPNHGNDWMRTIDLKLFESISKLPYVNLYSLQKELVPVRKRNHLTVNIMDQSENVEYADLAPEIQDFSDLARYIKRMDLIICVDSGVAHLAGAMGKPTWLLVPKIPDWRWLLEGDKTVWYPSITLFRQDKILEWEPVFERMRVKLSEGQILQSLQDMV